MEQTSATIAGDLASTSEALRHLGCPSRIFVQTESTNDDARDWAGEDAPHGAVVIADTQRHGRGRMGRSWSCPPGSTLAFSMVLRPTLDPGELPKLALVVGLATRAVLQARLPESQQVALKWPNDVVVFEPASPDRTYRKLAGILMEGSLSGSSVAHVVAGIGINVHRDSFPPELEATATSLSRCGATELDRTLLAVDLARSVLDHVAEFAADPSLVAVQFARHDVLRGSLLRLEDGTSGLGDGLATDGRLRVLRKDGSLALARAGEVTPSEARVVVPWNPT